MIVLRTPKGWTGPKVVDGRPVGGHLPRAPGAAARTWRTNPEHLAQLEEWMRSLPAGGAVRRATARSAPSSRALAPRGRRDAWAPIPHANGGLLLRATCELPDFRDYAVDVPEPGAHAPARPPGSSGRSCATCCAPTPRRRTSGSSAPTRRRRTGWARCSRRPTGPGRRRSLTTDDHLAPDGRVMEVLSEHLCQGWLEGYLLTGRHGLFNCYEAFIHIVDSMFNQHAKWLKVTREIPWRRPIAVAELPAQLARLAPGPQRLLPPGPGLHRPRREQEGGGRARLPAAGRQLPALRGRPLPAQPRLRQRHRGRQAARAGLPDAWTRRSRTAPAGSASGTGRPATRARCPTSCSPAPATCPPLETLAAAALLREHLPDLRVRVVNVVDLMRLQPETRAPARPLRPRLRRALHARPAGDLRLPRLSVAHPPPDLPAHQPPADPRPRLQGGGDDHDAVRHAACSTTSTASTWSWTSSTASPASGVGRGPAPADGGRAPAPPRVHPGDGRRPGRRCATGPGRPERARARPGRQRRLEQPEARRARRRPRRRGGRARARRGPSSTPARWPRRSAASGRSTRSGTGSCTAARATASPCASTPRCSARSPSCPRSRRCTRPSPWPRSTAVDGCS